jgi:hypothetical protein
LAKGWDKLSPEQRLMAIGQIGFWGGMMAHSSHEAMGNNFYASKDVDAFMHGVASRPKESLTAREGITQGGTREERIEQLRQQQSGGQSPEELRVRLIELRRLQKEQQGGGTETQTKAETIQSMGKATQLEPQVKSPEIVRREQELSQALPKRQQVPVEIDPSLQGNAVRVHYSVDKKGQIVDIQIKAGAQATPKDIQLHASTVKRMQQYSGLSRHVQRMKDHIHGWINQHGAPPVGTKAWEAQLEIDKLPKIIAERAERLANGGLDERSQLRLEAELADLKLQMATHERTLQAMDRDPGKGFVAAERTPLSQKELTALREAGLSDAEITRQMELMGDIYLFRGTTEGFPGHPALQKFGITPASVDPLVATVFGLEGKNKGNAILSFGSRSSFESGEIDLGNVRRTLEREVQVDLPPSEFQKRAQGTISVDRARQILKDMKIADLPASLRSFNDSTQILESTPRLTPEQINEFLKRAANPDY